ncbi:MAG: SPOR domain-containing protein [Calditrichaeota bacterium]|nr:SPOR domain-containing protein [Calditrichota bacterium]
MMIDWKKGSLLLLFAGILMLSCATTRKATEPAPEAAKAPPSPLFDESFDPLTLNDEDIRFEEEKVPETGEPATTPATGKGPATRVEANRLINGFRVQLLATKDIETATLAKKEAEFTFAEDSVGIYIEFDSPYYKLRIGDCKTREEAERLRDIARTKGYPQAWIVRTKVWSNPNLPKTATENP